MMKTQAFNRKLIACLLILFYLPPILAQNKAKTQSIDQSIVIADQYYQNWENEKLLRVTKNILTESTRLKCNKGLAYGNYFIAAQLHHVGGYTESIHHLQKVKQYSQFLSENPKFEAKNYLLVANNYHCLELFSLATQYYHKSLLSLKKIKTKNETEALIESSVYNYLSDLYDKMDLNDSVAQYLSKEKNSLRKVHSKSGNTRKGIFYASLGQYHFKNKNPDSALIYYKKAIEVYNQTLSPQNVGAYYGIANLYASRKDYQNALVNYKIVLENNKKTKSIHREIEVYKTIGRTYDLLNDTENAKLFLNLYISKKDSLETAKEFHRNQIVSALLKAEKDSHKRNMEKHFFWEIFICILVAILYVAWAYLYKKLRSKNIKESLLSKQMLQEKDLLLHQKTEETQELQQKINSAFEEVIVLAKENRPEFLKRFLEVYPEFSEKILKINPSIVNSEIKFCALLYLNFSTKNIALFTCTSPRTVQNRKYSIRKKLSISTDQDLYMWFKNI